MIDYKKMNGVTFETFQLINKACMLLMNNMFGNINQESAEL